MFHPCRCCAAARLSGCLFIGIPRRRRCFFRSQALETPSATRQAFPFSIFCSGLSSLVVSRHLWSSYPNLPQQTLFLTMIPHFYFSAVRAMAWSPERGGTGHPAAAHPVTGAENSGVCAWGEGGGGHGGYGGYGRAAADTGYGGAAGGKSGRIGGERRHSPY